MPTDAAWTIDQLTERVAAVLAADYPGQASGRVREIPNVRTIRWYTTIGLLDRPGAMRGRTALYGRRHLAQLVAIKRMQAEGRTLTEVQEQLVGADDATLFRIAELDERGLGDPDAADARAEGGGDSRERFWSATPSPGRTAARPSAATPARPNNTASAPRPVAVTPTRLNDTDAALRPAAAAPTQLGAAHPPRPEPQPEPATLVHGLRLAEDVTLLLTGGQAAPDTAARHAIEEAARPLLTLLRTLGLADNTDNTPLGD